MIHDSLDCNIIFCHFWTFFCPFTPPTTQKNKILKKWKICLKISSFYISVPKITFICYIVPETCCMTDKIVIFHFGYFLLFYQILKNEKNAWKSHHFTNVYQKLWSDDVRFLRYDVQQTDGQKDGWKKWHIEVGAPHLKICISFSCNGFFRHSKVFRNLYVCHTFLDMVDDFTFFL